MKKGLGCVVLILLMTGCDGNSGKPKSSTGLAGGIKALEKQQKSYQAKFDYAYKHLKTINQQLPKLNKKLQSQIISVSKNSAAQLKQVNNNLGDHIKSFHKEINEFGEQVAKSGH